MNLNKINSYIIFNKIKKHFSRKKCNSFDLQCMDSRFDKNTKDNHFHHAVSHSDNSDWCSMQGWAGSQLKPAYSTKHQLNTKKHQFQDRARNISWKTDSETSVPKQT